MGFFVLLAAVAFGAIYVDDCREDSIVERTAIEQGERARLPGVDADVPLEAFGACHRCDDSWAYVQGHSTPYGAEGRGCFPLCEDCWIILTPEERLPYYREMWEGWFRWAKNKEQITDLNKRWVEIEGAVLGGK